MNSVLSKSNSSILRDAPQADLARAVELNQAAWIEFGGKLPDVRLHLDDDATWVCSKLSGRPNSIAMARFPQERADQRIGQILATYEACDAHAVWWIGPSSRPADLGRRLRDAGFHCFKHFPAMAADLRKLNRFPQPPGLRIQIIEDFSIFDQHEHPFIGPITTDRQRRMLENHRLMSGIGPRRVWAFLATISRKPVGHAMMFQGAGVAGVYEVGVVKEFRRRGIGAAVTLAALDFARKRGNRYAVLQASGQGQSMYRRIGFEEVCRISLWFYSRKHH